MPSQTLHPGSNKANVAYPKYVIVGDNIDHNVYPRHMTPEKLFHHFHSYAVHDRVELTAVSENILTDLYVEALPLTAFLPSLDDYITIADRSAC